ncbi:MAG: DUF2911 domain-containing protein [Gemmatimonadota bacterium]
MNDIRRRGISLAVLVGAMVLGTEIAEAQERASPLDHARAEIAGQQIEIQYGRPSMRGRTVFGGIVPWGEVWRTGANEATHLRVPADMTIGGETVPAGEYTLWTVPSEDGWTLVVNSETGQWGTAYNADHDLVRVPMMTETLDEAVEVFTIRVTEGDGSDGVIMMDWENTRASVGFDIGG